MKKFFALFLALACVVATGCDKGTSTDPAPKTTTPAASGDAAKTADGAAKTADAPK